MRVLITGASGLVGRAVTEHLNSSPHILITPSHAELDLTAYNHVLDYFMATNPDLVIHCAGKVGGIQANVLEPFSFMLENMDMGRNVVLAAKQAGVTKLINLASSCLYPHDSKNPLQEASLLTGPFEPTNEGYALAKVMVLKLCEYLHQENSIYNYKTLIPCNLFGKYDSFQEEKSHLLPAIIVKIHNAKVLKQNSVEIWGTGTARREFMFASDLADCIWQAAHNYEQLPQIMNVGLGYDYSILEYYQMVARHLGWQGDFSFNLQKPEGMQQKLLCLDRQNSFGWQAKTSVEDGLKQTINWYIQNIACNTGQSNC